MLYDAFRYPRKVATCSKMMEMTTGWWFQISDIAGFSVYIFGMMIMNWPSYPWDWLKPPAGDAFTPTIHCCLAPSTCLLANIYFVFLHNDMKSPENVGPMSWWCQVVSQEVHASTLRPSWGRFGMARQAPSWSKFEILANPLADRSFSDLFWAWVRIDSIQPSLLLTWVCQSHGLSAQGSNSACDAVISLLRLGLNQWGTPSIPKDESILCPFPALGGIHAGTNPQIMFAWSWLGFFWLGGP